LLRISQKDRYRAVTIRAASVIDIRRLKRELDQCLDHGSAN
jgi:hypothetical protein